MGEVSTTGTNGQAGKEQRRGRLSRDELLHQLARAIERAEEAEGRLAALGAQAPLSGGPCPEGLLARAEGTIRAWVFTHDNGYRICLAQLEPPAWVLVKWSDGTRYTVKYDDKGQLICTCKGCTEYGPQCANGQGCKHMRALRALRQLVHPGL
jgi:hypothetical protein